MTIDLQPVRQVAPSRDLARPSFPSRRPAVLGDLDPGAAYDQSVKTIVFVAGTAALCAFILYRDTKRGFYSGKASKAISTDEAITRLVAIGGGYFFLRQVLGKTALTPW